MIPTRQDVLDADPGLELDGWVFAHVVGRCLTCGWRFGGDGLGCTALICKGEPNNSPLPAYSASSEAASRVLERMSWLGWSYNIDVAEGSSARCHFRRGGETYAADGREIAEAIAKAAVLAILGLKEQK